MSHVPINFCELHGPIKRAVIACFEDSMLNKDNIPYPKFCLPNKDTIRSIIDWLELEYKGCDLCFNIPDPEFPQILAISTPEYDLLKQGLEEKTLGHLILLEWQESWKKQIQKLKEL